MLHTKFEPNIPSHSGEKFILLVLLFLALVAILDSRQHLSLVMLHEI